MRSIRNCNVAVVGGAGFLGSHLVDHLVDDRGCEVTVVDNLCAGRREFVHPKARFNYHDITGSEDWLRRLFAERRVRFVFNYAAWPYVPDSFARPLHVSMVNFVGACKVISAAAEAGAEGILQVSSAEIYGDAGSVRDKRSAGNSWERIPETAPAVPHSSYGVSKLAVDNWVQCRWWEAKVPCIALRQFNCVGARETHDYVVPTIISQLARQDPDACGRFEDGSKCINDCLVKLGNNSFRDFLWAGDQARIATELLERGQFGECYNLGSESGVKIYDLAKLIAKVMGFGEVWIEEDEARKRPKEIWHLCSDNSKLWNTLYGKVGQPREHPLPPSATGPKFLTLEEALRRTVEWHRSNGCRWPWEERV